MTASMWHLRTAPKVALALIGVMISFDPASAAPPELGTSGLSPAQCYRRDSQCTEFCGKVQGDLRYECFNICDRMLNNCLNTGEWDDSPAELDPGSGQPPKNDGPFSHVNAEAFMQMMVLLADTDGDGALSLPEIQTVHERAFKQIDANGDGKATRAEIKLFFEMDGPARR